MITVTESALDAIRRVKGEAAGLRIMVSAGGCAGYQYRMGLVRSAEDGDAVVSFEDVSIFIDADSAALLAGTTVDYVDEIGGAGFRFDNPNAEGKCSCGKSFAA